MKKNTNKLEALFQKNKRLLVGISILVLFILLTAVAIPQYFSQQKKQVVAQSLGNFKLAKHDGEKQAAAMTLVHNLDKTYGIKAMVGQADGPEQWELCNQIQQYAHLFQSASQNWNLFDDIFAQANLSQVPDNFAISGTGATYTDPVTGEVTTIQLNADTAAQIATALNQSHREMCSTYQGGNGGAFYPYFYDPLYDDFYYGECRDFYYETSYDCIEDNWGMGAEAY
jgi:hypothetical protein